MNANDKQVGGEHYKLSGKGEEHWDRIWRMHGRGYFVGCITKYVERYHLKNGVQDLEKAKHFLEKLIELETKDSKSCPSAYSKDFLGEQKAMGNRQENPAYPPGSWVPNTRPANCPV